MKSPEAGTERGGQAFSWMIETSSQILEGSFRIAWDYLEASGMLGQRDGAARFLLDSIEGKMGRGERRKLLLSNLAIDEYREWRSRADLALVS